MSSSCQQRTCGIFLIWIKDITDWAVTKFSGRVVEHTVLERYVGKEVSIAELPAWCFNVADFAMPGVPPLKGA